MQLGLFEDEHYRYNRNGTKDEIENIVQRSRANRQEICDKKADIKPHMAEAHENYGVFADIFQRAADDGEAAQIFKPAEEVDP